MNTIDNDGMRKEQTREYLEQFFGTVSTDPALELGAKGHTTLTRRNQAEFHADAPWRLEPDQDSVPLLFVIRDANLRWPGQDPWRLQRLEVQQELPTGGRRTLCSYSAAGLPDVHPDGTIEANFWVFRTRISLDQLEGIDMEQRDTAARLRVTFDGHFPPAAGSHSHAVHRYLEVYLARESLPLGRAANGSGPRHWFYGDTHYHSAYTNDIWEFGNPVRDARHAGMAIGLDWLVITDHSCDLDDRDNGDDSPIRWDQLKQDLAHPSISDHQFRCILGEEITLLKGGISYLHMLAFGGLHELIPGGFWSEDDHLVKQVAEEFAKIAARQGYPSNAVERLFGPVYGFEEVLSQLPPETLIFAAHPYIPAQPPFINGTWDKEQLAHPRLTGHEFWNTRIRRHTDPLFDPTNDPFQEPEWNDSQKLAKADRSRVAKLQKWAEEKWDPVLQQGVDEWPSPDQLPERRPVFIAGSDAHGDFNYCVGIGWNYRQHGLIVDNALGRVRTVAHLPHHQSNQVPPIDQILTALKQGSCVVTDGPVIEFSLRQNGQVARMGQVLVLDGNDRPTVDITIHTTPEFGPAKCAEVVTYMRGNGNGERNQTTVDVGKTASIALNGTRGYCRIAVQTTGRDGEWFCCFTNPIWLWNREGQTIDLRVRVEQRGC
ncbi:MAG: hypothetical protein GY832_46850 [Chloroflexi bacterium]|nr:hypothetical protein [Chloroflexota bacterium]